MDNVIDKIFKIEFKFKKFLLTYKVHAGHGLYIIIFIAL